jgi:hypothetical protein
MNILGQAFAGFLDWNLGLEFSDLLGIGEMPTHWGIGEIRGIIAKNFRNLRKSRCQNPNEYKYQFLKIRQ